MPAYMVAWWTNKDIEIICSHQDNYDSEYIQISDIADDDGAKIYECKLCGQKYSVTLKITRIEKG